MSHLPLRVLGTLLPARGRSVWSSTAQYMEQMSLKGRGSNALRLSHPRPKVLAEGPHMHW